MSALPTLIRWVEEQRVHHAVGAAVAVYERQPRAIRAHRSGERMCEAIARELRQIHTQRGAA